jgi:hypothetical protein
MMYAVRCQCHIGYKHDVRHLELESAHRIKIGGPSSLKVEDDYVDYLMFERLKHLIPRITMNDCMRVSGGPL